MFNLLKSQTYSVYYININSGNKKLLNEFSSKKEAELFIHNTIQRDLNKFFTSLKSYKELIECYLENIEYRFKINNEEFNLKNYLNTIVPSFYRNKLNKTINGSLYLTTDKNIKNILQDIQDCEIIEVKKLQNAISFIYIKNGARKYLTLQDSYYINSKDGTGSFFEFKNTPLSKVKIEKKYNVEKQSFQEIEYLQESHPFMNDIYSIVTIFYLEDIDLYSKIGKVEVIYQTKEGFTNSYQLYFLDNCIAIEKYENIFAFNTKILEDNNRTQLEFLYNDKYFLPLNYYDTIDKKTGSIIREKKGDNPYEYPCTTFGKKIQFKINEAGDIVAYNLAIFGELDLIKEEILSYLTKKEKQKLIHFIAIAQLYLNDLFVNKQLDNTYTLDTHMFAKDKKKIEILKEKLNSSNWKKELYYKNNEDKNKKIQVVTIYYNKQNIKQRFVTLEQTTTKRSKFILKYNNNIKDKIEQELFSILVK